MGTKIFNEPAILIGMLNEVDAAERLNNILLRFTSLNPTSHLYKTDLHSPQLSAGIVFAKPFDAWRRTGFRILDCLWMSFYLVTVHCLSNRDNNRDEENGACDNEE